MARRDGTLPPSRDAQPRSSRCGAELATLREAIEQHGSTTYGAGEPVRDHRHRRADTGSARRELSAKLAELDARVTAVSTELANQLTELGHDIDSLGARPPGDGSEPAAVGELRDGQVRLANEQARYQIAFREDLARLADELKRSR